jgi:hypothetical protein
MGNCLTCKHKKCKFHQHPCWDCSQVFGCFEGDKDYYEPDKKLIEQMEIDLINKREGETK